MSEYVDKYGLYHHKKVVEGEPSSNNGWIYTAYAALLGITIDKMRLIDCFQRCIISSEPFKMNRLPGKGLPPMSRDEVLGLVSLGILDDHILYKQHYQFCNLPNFEPKSLWKVSWVKALKAAWRIRNSHRNALWDEPDLWHFGFRLPPQDTYYVIKKAGGRPGFLHTLYFYVSTYNSGSHLIPWLKLKSLGMEKSWLYRRINLPLALEKEFGYPGRVHDFLLLAPPPRLAATS